MGWAFWKGQHRKPGFRDKEMGCVADSAVDYRNKEPSVALKAFNNYLSECGLQTIGSKTFNAALIRVFGLASVLVTVSGKCVRRLRS
jgi:hypothetical protein